MFRQRRNRFEQSALVHVETSSSCERSSLTRCAEDEVQISIVVDVDEQPVSSSQERSSNGRELGDPCQVTWVRDIDRGGSAVQEEHAVRLEDRSLEAG